MRHIKGLEPLLKNYSGLLVDLWGVMHNGKRLFPGAVEALQAARQAGLKIILLSNAPRRAAQAEERLVQGLGLDAALFDHLVTSGQEVHDLLRKPGEDPFYKSLEEAPIYALAPQRDLPFFEGLKHSLVDQLDLAKAVVCLGPEDGLKDTTSYQELLAEAAARQLPMICANPDRRVVKGADWQICAGAQAEAYAQLGGQVRWHGKPYAGVYERCLETLALPAGEVLAIGDSLATDVTGALAQGIDVLWLGSGIHADALKHTSPEALAAAKQLSPTYFATDLQA